MVDHPVEFGLQGLQVGNLLFDLVTVMLGNGIDRSAGLAPIVRQGEQRSNLFKRKTKVARPSNETQAVQMRLVVGPIVSLCAGCDKVLEVNQKIRADGLRRWDMLRRSRDCIFDDGPTLRIGPSSAGPGLPERIGR